MPSPIKIPDLGAAADEVTLTRWLVEEGATISRGDQIAEIETDKAVVALESFADGILLKKCIADGEDAVTGDIIAYVGDPNDSIPGDSQPGPEDSKRLPESPLKEAPPVQSRAIATSLISPMVRNFAKLKGVNLDDIVGTGAGGAITRQDILAAARRGD